MVDRGGRVAEFLGKATRKSIRAQLEKMTSGQRMDISVSCEEEGKNGWDCCLNEASFINASVFPLKKQAHLLKEREE